MNILEKLMSKEYPKFDSKVTADEKGVIVEVTEILAPCHVDLDNAGYLEKKIKKEIPVLKGIFAGKSGITNKWEITVTVGAEGNFNKVACLNHLERIAKAICEIAESRLSEPEVIKNIKLDCESFVVNEPEEKHEDA